jgi:phosphoesterase RecJ-like protein
MSKKVSSTVGKIIGILSARNKWLVLTHEKPDGDTLGCAIALAALGARLGKQVIMGGPSQYPDKYSFMLEDIPYSALDMIPADFSGDDCVIICVDISRPERAVKGLEEASGRCLVINIDHHEDNPKYGCVNWIDSSASATGEMVTELLSSSCWGITAAEAQSLYTAIVTDNGHFKFPSSSKKSHEYAAKLIQAGASPEIISEELETNLSENVLRLWGRAFERVETFSGGFCAIFCLAQSDFEETGTTENDKENLVNYLLRIRGVRLAALCTEAGEEVRVSLRARAPYAAQAIAHCFGGGGHKLAAGCTIYKPLSEALPLLRNEMERHVATLPSGA